jgi:hypothetical protein
MCKEFNKRKKTGKRRKTGEGYRARKREERIKGTKTKNEGIKGICEKKERANRIADDERKKTGFEIGKRADTNNQGKENTVLQTEDDKETEKY